MIKRHRSAPRASRFTPHAAHLTPHASRLTPHASRLTLHASRLTPHASRNICNRMVQQNCEEEENFQMLCMVEHRGGGERARGRRARQKW